MKGKVDMFSRRLTVGSFFAVVGLGFGLLTATAPASQAAVYGCPTSTVCLFTGNNFTGDRQDMSGYTQYADVNSVQHDNTTSWINANLRAYMGIGEYRNGKKYTGQILKPGWAEWDLRFVSPGLPAPFNNMIDYVFMA